MSYLKVARLAVGEVMKRLPSVAGPVLRKSPEALARIGTRLGVDGAKLGVQGILNAAKNNKLTTAMILYELGTEGADLLADLRINDESVDQLVHVLDQEPVDSVNFAGNSGGLNGTLGNFTDEFRDLSSAIVHYGSLERFLAVKRALQLDKETIALYIQTRSMGRSLA